ncbi:Centrosomal protein CCDC61, partial [Cymbomonas tetramitiformis]
MAAPEFSETVEMIFHNVEYLLTVAAVKDETLCIEVEQKRDGSRWRGDFTSKYIEDITAKTGNYKKYPVFVKMLLTAVTEESDSVFVDLLTYNDLEMLKSRKMRGGAAAPPPAPASNRNNNKRYLILTYAAEFDRVHYPLPLMFEESPDPEALKATIRRLREELDTSAKGKASQSSGPRSGTDPAELRRLREENNELKGELRRYESSGRGAQGPEPAGPGFSQGERKELERELRLCRKERDLLAQRCEARELELEQQAQSHKRALARKQKEVDGNQEEAARKRDSERELRLKVRDLTAELDAAHRRARAAGRSTTAREPLHRERKVYGGAGSRTNSRGPSPSTSRLNSRGVSPSSSRGVTPPGSRPTSASRRRPTSAPTSRPNTAVGG